MDTRYSLALSPPSLPHPISKSLHSFFMIPLYIYIYNINVVFLACIFKNQWKNKSWSLDKQLTTNKRDGPEGWGEEQKLFFFFKELLWKCDFWNTNISHNKNRINIFKKTPKEWSEKKQRNFGVIAVGDAICHRGTSWDGPQAAVSLCISSRELQNIFCNSDVIIDPSICIIETVVCVAGMKQVSSYIDYAENKDLGYGIKG